MTVPKGDELRTPDLAFSPDPRSPMFNRLHISDQYHKIAPYQLEEYVPEEVAAQYEVARNIYLYAYNVYRFYMVAQHQALVSLEYAINECIGKDAIRRYGREINKGRGLSASLRYLFDKGLISNDDFPVWRNRRRMDAEQQYEFQKIAEMEDKGLESIELDFDKIDYEAHELEYDYLEVLSETMPYFRNLHAHGSSHLHNQVLITFENVSVIINKIFHPEISNK
jgi:hypothetical protein